MGVPPKLFCEGFTFVIPDTLIPHVEQEFPGRIVSSQSARPARACYLSSSVPYIGISATQFRLLPTLTFASPPPTEALPGRPPSLPSRTAQPPHPIRRPRLLSACTHRQASSTRKPTGRQREPTGTARQFRGHHNSGDTIRNSPPLALGQTRGAFGAPSPRPPVGRPPLLDAEARRPPPVRHASSSVPYITSTPKRLCNRKKYKL
jgi:hypothetical protein